MSLHEHVCAWTWTSTQNVNAHEFRMFMSFALNATVWFGQTIGLLVLTCASLSASGRHGHTHTCISKLTGLSTKKKYSMAQMTHTHTRAMYFRHQKYEFECLWRCCQGMENFRVSYSRWKRKKHFFFYVACRHIRCNWIANFIGRPMCFCTHSIFL